MDCMHAWTQRLELKRAVHIKCRDCGEVVERQPKMAKIEAAVPKAPSTRGVVPPMPDIDYHPVEVRLTPEQRRQAHVESQNEVLAAVFVGPLGVVKVVFPRWRSWEVGQEMERRGYDEVWDNADEHGAIDRVVDINKQRPQRARVASDYPLSQFEEDDDVAF